MFKKFVFLFSIIIIAYISLMWFSPVASMSRKHFSKNALKRIEETKTLPFYNTREMTFVKMALIDKYKPDCILMGSSRVVELSIENLPYFKDCRKTLNVAIWGNSYYSSLLMANKLYSKKIKKILWAWNPEENLNPVYGSETFLGTETYLAEKKLLIRKPNFSQAINIWKTFKTLFQIKFIKYILGDLKPKKKQLIIDDESKIDKNGVLTYSNKQLQKVKETRKLSTQKALEIISRAQSNYIDLNKWCRILDHPTAKTLVVTVTTHGKLLNKGLKSKTQELEKTCNLKTYKVDMKNFCSEKDQIDKFHYTKACLKKVFSLIN